MSEQDPQVTDQTTIAPATPLPRLGSGFRAATLTVLVVLWTMATANATFWGHALRIMGDSPVSLILFGSAIFFLYLSLVLPFTQRWIVKPFLIFLLLSAAAASHFLETYGTVIDREMIQNAMTTTTNEAKHLLTWGLLRDMLTFGIAPAVAVILLPLQRERFWPKTLRTAGLAALAFALSLGLLLSDYARFSSIFREQKELMASFNPGAPITGAIRYGKLLMRTQNVVAEPIGTDARPGPWLATATRPVVAVIVVGETSRAANWQLSGYARPTNPELSTRDITYFTDVTACGTSTAVSVPCMFSDLTRDRYSHAKGLARENLLDVLGYAGFRTLWLDNNTGSQKLARRTVEENLSKGSDPEICPSGECDDRVLLNRLTQELDRVTGNTAIVLHTIGSHGPSYYLRYDRETAPFADACETGELGKCSADQIVNAYDNTIAFTDRMLAQMIDALAARDDITPLLLYVSDHGESLGEGGLYLHAAPWFMAPETQTKVPMLTWLPPETATALGIDPGCLDAKADLPVAHDNLFASILGLLDIQTEVRDPALDLAEGCRLRPAG